jgi:hypothetical protein
LCLDNSSLSQLCLLDQDLFEHLMSLIDADRFVHDLYIRFLTTLLLLPFLLCRLRLLLLPSTTTCTSSTPKLELLLLLSEKIPAFHLNAVTIPAIISHIILSLLLLLLILIVVEGDLLLHHGMLKALHDPLE